MRFALALPAPQSFFQHPPPQRLRVDPHLVFTGQMLGCQCRPKPLSHSSPVLLPHLPGDTASTTASLAGNSIPANWLRRSASVLCPSLAPILLHASTPSCSS